VSSCLHVGGTKEDFAGECTKKSEFKKEEGFQCMKGRIMQQKRTHHDS